MARLLDLHPIMFLLNQRNHEQRMVEGQDLHPIMFLLNLFNSFTDRLKLSVFTSHYVPIKSI